METVPLNETKTERYVSFLKRNYDNEDFCVLNTNAIHKSLFL